MRDEIETMYAAAETGQRSTEWKIAIARSSAEFSWHGKQL